MTVAPVFGTADDRGILYSLLGMEKLCDGETCHCASACFLIWAAGIERTGHVVGLHRPSTRSISFAGLPPNQASSLHRTLLTNVGSYLKDMEIPAKYIETMTGTSSADIRWLTPEDLSSLEEVPSIAEWLSTSCGKVSEREKAEAFANRGKVSRRFLFQKESDTHRCNANKISRSRDTIAE